MRILFVIWMVSGLLFAGDWDDGVLRFRSEDGHFETRLDVRMYLDGAVYFEEEDFCSDGTDLRRGRFALKTRLWEVWQAEWDVDLAVYHKEEDEKAKGPEIKDMWLAYNGLEGLQFKVGEFKPPFSLEELTSSRYITFLERGYPNLFTPGRRCGLGITNWGDFWHVSGGVFSESVNNLDKKTDEEGSLAACRIAVAPVRDDGIVFHAGGSFLQQTPDAPESGGEGLIELDTQPETRVARAQFLDTDDITRVRFMRCMGAEGAIQWGPVSVQGEYITSEIERKDDLETVEFAGGYVLGSWFITGESKPYDMASAEFESPKPLRDWGAIELAVRYSHIDLSHPEANVRGGKAADVTIGLNWYANANIRIMTNYVVVDNSEYADGNGKYDPDYDFSYIAARVQVTF